MGGPPMKERVQASLLLAVRLAGLVEKVTAVIGLGLIFFDILSALKDGDSGVKQ